MNQDGSNRRFIDRQKSGNYGFVPEEASRMFDDALADDEDNSTKTSSRLLVENYLSKKSWYFPQKDDPDAPSLRKAWTFYEYVTLPRYLVEESGFNGRPKRAEPGDLRKESELYNPFKPLFSSFLEWGIGIGLYFETALILSALLFIAGLINLAPIVFYESEQYWNFGDEEVEKVNFLLKGSMACSNTEWVVCEDCCETMGLSSSRIVNTTTGVCLAKRNLCDIDNGQAFYNLATLLFVFVSLALISTYLQKKEIILDEGHISATDYSIEVKNPPHDATDPDVWRSFFSTFTEEEDQVIVVTIALDNEALLKKLIARRSCSNELRLMLPKDTNMDDKDEVQQAIDNLKAKESEKKTGCFDKLMKRAISPILRLGGLFLPADVLVQKIDQLTTEIKVIEGKKSRVCRIFVTFETEESQRAILEAFKASKIGMFCNYTSGVAKEIIFENRRLNVKLPTEPSAVRWRELGASEIKSFAVQFINFLITCALLFGSGYVVKETREAFGEYGPMFSGFFISFSNLAINAVVKNLVTFETHPTEGRFQQSLYIKITIFRWINTAVIFKIVVPVQETISFGNNDLLYLISSILFFELLFTPAILLIDPLSFVKKHYLAPRAITQEQMNANFSGTIYTLSERYTNLTKLLFLCFFYSALYPVVFFWGSGIVLVQYFVDKWCLMRLWNQLTPQLGNELAVFSRKLFALCTIAFGLLSALTYYQYPFDGLCPVGNQYYDLPTIFNIESEVYTVENNNTFCNCKHNQYFPMEWFTTAPAEVGVQSNAALEESEQEVCRMQQNWMDTEQNITVILFIVCAFIIIIIYTFVMFLPPILRLFKELFVGASEEFGMDQKIDFSCNTEIPGYVPQTFLKDTTYPLLLCDTSNIENELIGWNSEQESYDKHNLVFDLPYNGIPQRNKEVDRIENDNEEDSKPLIFSIVKQYPTSWKKKE